MKKKILIPKKEFEKIDLRRVKDVERVDVTDEGVEITFLISDK
ncbi:hypothetical protein LCGC14_1050970 [marine sediment metagenome]|uniref:Uncharacterized protein n=2 Tax=marine sediment metagenome TaxID=412755 RepID=A0A0F9MTA6_9ZZZZ